MENRLKALYAQRDEMKAGLELINKEINDIELELSAQKLKTLFEDIKHQFVKIKKYGDVVYGYVDRYETQSNGGVITLTKAVHEWDASDPNGTILLRNIESFDNSVFCKDFEYEIINKNQYLEIVNNIVSNWV